MNVSRESVSVALFSLFTPLLSPTGAPNPPTQPFISVTRLFPNKAAIESNPQPALYLIEADENDDEQQTYGAQRYILRFRLFVFGQTPSDNQTAPGTIINPLLDAVDAAMGKTPAGTPLNGEFQRLVNIGQPPLIANAWINGRVFKSYSELSSQNFAVVPISVVTGQ